MSAPVLLIVFNRPRQTEKVFAAIRQARPSRLFIAADGPRNTAETAICEEVRSIVASVDWPCEVASLFHSVNLGCRKAVSGALDWFFEHVEEGIVLEDDCLPAPDFFPFCTNLLANYRTDTRVMHIGGFNCQDGRTRGAGSYYFSRYLHVWGWATWRRAWRLYDGAMKSYPDFIAARGLEDSFPSGNIRRYWRMCWKGSAAETCGTWDYQWVYTVLSHGGLGITPNVPLVDNIGFGLDATHTTGAICSRGFPGRIQQLKHPAFALVDHDADVYTYQHHLRLYDCDDPKDLFRRWLRSLSNYIRYRVWVLRRSIRRRRGSFRHLF